MKARRAARIAAWTAGGALALGLAAALLSPARLEAMAAATAAWRPALTVARVAGLVALWIWWEALVARVPGATEEGRRHLSGRRHFYVACLAAVELLIVQDGAGAAWRALQ